MSKVTRLEDRRESSEAIYDQAGIYLAQLERGASDAEQEIIERWLSESLQHRRVFLHMAKLWDEMSLLSGLAAVFPLDDYKQTRAAAATWRWLASAVCLVLVAGLTLWAWRDGLPWLSADAATALVYEAQHETVVGEQSEVALPDGSTIMLNTASHINVVYTPEARNVMLSRGEAYFNVEADAERPFRVYAGDQLVEVSGTAFTVQRLDNDGLEVMVRTGRVEVHRIQRSHNFPLVPDDIGPLLPTQGFSLTTGDMATVPDSLQDMEIAWIRQETIEQALAWTRGRLVFADKSLALVLTEMARYTTVILDADNSILDMRVQGEFATGDIDGLLSVMRNQYDIEATRMGSGYIRLHPAEQDSS